MLAGHPRGVAWCLGRAGRAGEEMLDISDADPASAGKGQAEAIDAEDGL